MFSLLFTRDSVDGEGVLEAVYIEGLTAAKALERIESRDTISFTLYQDGNLVFRKDTYKVLYESL